MSYPVPANEVERLRTLRSYTILDTKPEERFDELTRLAALICGVPISLISLIDKDRQWFKSRFGLDVQVLMFRKRRARKPSARTRSCSLKCSSFRTQVRTSDSRRIRSTRVELTAFSHENIALHSPLHLH
jgi:hypothetical protein